MSWVHEDVPESLRPLLALLGSEGFSPVEDDRDPFIFGDRRFRWERHDLRIQVSLDRGRWFVDVSPSWWTEWFGYGLEIVMDTLDDVDRFTHLLTLRESIEILASRLPDIVALLSSQEGCNEVEAKQHDRAQRWFGA